MANAAPFQAPPPRLLPLPPTIPANTGYFAYWCEENIYMLAQACLADEAVHRNWDVYAVFISNEGRTAALWKQRQRASAVDSFVVWDYHVILVLKPLKSGRDPAKQVGSSSANCDQLHDVNASAWVYDFDTWLEKPCLWSEYIEKTFPYLTLESKNEDYRFPDQYRRHVVSLDDCLGIDAFPFTLPSKMRVIAGQEFVDWFASDRSHMLKTDDDGLTSANSDIREQARVYNAPPPTYDCIQGAKAREAGLDNNLMTHFVNMDPETSSINIGRVYTLDEASAFFCT